MRCISWTPQLISNLQSPISNLRWSWRTRSYWSWRTRSYWSWRTRSYFSVYQRKSHTGFPRLDLCYLCYLCYSCIGLAILVNQLPSIYPWIPLLSLPNSLQPSCRLACWRPLRLQLGRLTLSASTPPWHSSKQEPLLSLNRASRSLCSLDSEWAERPLLIFQLWL